MFVAAIIAFLVFLCMTVCMLVVGLIFGYTKKAFAIATVLCIIILIWQKGFGAWDEDRVFWSIIGVIGGIVWSLFLAKKRMVDFICPNCGAWEEYEEIEMISESEWDSLDDVEVERKIYNKNHEEIGSFTDTKKEWQRHSAQVWLVECKKCGKRSYITK